MTKVVAKEATLTTLLPAAEQLLQGLAKAETATSPANGMGQVLPPPLAGRIALAALYRLWDTLHQQLHLYYGFSDHRVAGAADAPHAHTVRVAAADLAVLGQATHALAHPTEELAAALGRANLAHRDALTQLLVVLDPPTDQAIRPADRPVIPSAFGAGKLSNLIGYCASDDPPVRAPSAAGHRPAPRF